MIAGLITLALMAAPKVINCVQPCGCEPSVRSASVRLAETTDDDRQINVAFDDHGVAVAIELVLLPGARPGATRIEVTTWEGAPVSAPPRPSEWKALEDNAWLKIVHVPVRAGTYRVVAHIALPCGDLAMRLRSVDVHRADPTSLAYWQLRTAHAVQVGALDEQVRAWKELEKVDGRDHALEMSVAMTRAGRVADAEKLIADFRQRAPRADVQRQLSDAYRRDPVRGTRYGVMESPPCSDSDYYEVRAAVVGAYPDLERDGGPAQPEWVVSADRVGVAVTYSSQAKRPEHAAVRIVFQGDAGTARAPAVWYERPGADTFGTHFPSAPATFVHGAFLFPVEPGSYRARVEVELSCGVLKDEVVFRAVVPSKDDPPYWLGRFQIALDAQDFKEALEDLDNYEARGGKTAGYERISVLEGLGRKSEAAELRKLLQRRTAPTK